MQGGIGDFTHHLAQEMAEQGHDVHILTHRKAKQPIKREPSKTVGEAFQRLGTVWEPQSLDYATIHPRFRRWNWGEMSNIADIAIRQDLDLLNLQYQPAAFNMRNPAVNFLPLRVNAITKLVTTFHDLRTPFLFPKAGGLRKRVVYKLAQRSHGVILTNPANKHELSRDGFGTKAETLIPIGNNTPATHVNHLEIDENRKELGVDESIKLIGFFGFLNKSKGCDHLIEALEQLDDQYHLLIIGGTAGASDTINNELYIEEIKQMISAKGLDDRVHWTGYLQPNRVSAWIKTTDMLVLPYQDGVSTRRGSLMTAMAHGMPIISTQAELINPLLQDGENMLLAPVGNTAGLVERINQFASNPDLAQTLGDKAKATADSFSWPNIAKQTLDFYYSVLESEG